MHTAPMTRRSVLAQIAAALVLGRATHVVAQDDNIFTFAVLGLDTRANDANQRSDAIMLSRVNLDEFTVRTLSIPRDLYVEIPGYGYSKINDAYQRGLASDPELKWQSGAEVFAKTIAHNFGIDIDGFAVIELQRLPELIDAVGGVEVDNPYAVVVKEFPNFSGGGTRELDFPAGVLTLDGAATMDYVRTRQQDSDGGRVMRQHLVLAALLEKLQQPEMLLRVPDLVADLIDIVHTDISPELQIKLIAALPQVSIDNIAFTNIDRLLSSGYTEGGAWIYRGDWNTLPAYVRSWLNGEVE